MTDVKTQIIEGRPTLVMPTETNLPKSMPDLLGAMAKMNVSFRDDFTLRGTRTACEQLRTHRFRRFREGRWWNPSNFNVTVGQGLNDVGKPELKVVTVTAGVRNLHLKMCEDCGAVQVHDVTPAGYAGARPARLQNIQTGEVRIAPAVGQPDIIIGSYSGKRRRGRTYS